MNIKINFEKDIKKYHAAALVEYEKRLVRYCKLKRLNCSEDELLSKQGYKILISSSGSLIASEELAKKIQTVSLNSVSEILINLKPASQKAHCYDECICISKMHIEHGLLAVIVFEQVYRAFRILNNEPYHK